MRTYRIFIYGTLKRGHYWHKLYLDNERCRYIGPGFADDCYSLYIDVLPFLVQEKSELGRVKGEIYEVSEDVLYAIDELEGCPSGYKREFIDVYNEAGEKQSLHAYVYPNVFRGKRHVYKDVEFV